MSEEARPKIKLAPWARGISLAERLVQFKREASFLAAGAGVLVMAPLADHYLAGSPGFEEDSGPVFAQRRAAPGRALRAFPWSGPALAAEALAPDPEPAAAAQTASPDPGPDRRDPSALAMGPSASANPPAMTALFAARSSPGKSDSFGQGVMRAASAAFSAAAGASGLPQPRPSWVSAGQQALFSPRRPWARALVASRRSTKGGELDSSSIRAAYSNLGAGGSLDSSSPENNVIAGDFGNKARAPGAQAEEGLKDQAAKDFDGAQSKASTPASSSKPESSQDKSPSSPSGAGGEDKKASSPGGDLSQICQDLQKVPDNPMAQKLMRMIGLVTVTETNLKEQGRLICAEQVSPQRFAVDPAGGAPSNVAAILRRAAGVIKGGPVLGALGEAVKACKDADRDVRSRVQQTSDKVASALDQAKSPCSKNPSRCDSTEPVNGQCGGGCAQCGAMNRSARQSAVDAANSGAKQEGCSSGRSWQAAYRDVQARFQNGQAPLKLVRSAADALNQGKVGEALEAVCRGAASGRACSASGTQDYMGRAQANLAEAGRLGQELSGTPDDVVKINNVTVAWRDWVKTAQAALEAVESGAFRTQLDRLNRLVPALPKLANAALKSDGGAFAVNEEGLIPKGEIRRSAEESVLSREDATALQKVLAKRWCDSPPQVKRDCDGEADAAAAVDKHRQAVAPVTANAQGKESDGAAQRALDEVRATIDSAGL